MSDKQPGNTNDLPADEHLRGDVTPGSGGDQAAFRDGGFTPGQTNAGQQVAGLASATGYGKDLDPEEQQDSNNPV
ncbi:hypothetical protein FBY31_2625 [Arthrobacter sp. SLBN-100]|uniref:hypothetical protein n=1 Tax=Arthrobacter sp. SLBN-100 TaxID=2768450 RepID=UPI001152485D|nr:hypothetical protein [Arthrobacter sp. SLBN-100]TQJ68519.1 hypothetical protein FBY31_2625 [Arthrobacter sp. SLBN-100]